MISALTPHLRSTALAFAGKNPTIRLVGLHEFNQIEHDKKVDAWEGELTHVHHGRPLEQHARRVECAATRKAFDCSNVALWNPDRGSLFHVWPKKFVDSDTFVVPKDSDLRKILAEDAKALSLPRKSPDAFVCGGWDMDPMELSPQAIDKKVGTVLSPQIKDHLISLAQSDLSLLHKSRTTFRAIKDTLKGAGIRKLSTIWGRRTRKDTHDNVGSNVILLPRQNEVILWHDQSDGPVLSLSRLKDVVNHILIAPGHRLVTKEGTLKGPFRFTRQVRKPGREFTRQAPKRPKFVRVS